jgi:hypothetical protein
MALYDNQVFLSLIPPPLRHSAAHRVVFPPLTLKDNFIRVNFSTALDYHEEFAAFNSIK